MIFICVCYCVKVVYICLPNFFAGVRSSYRSDPEIPPQKES